MIWENIGGFLPFSCNGARSRIVQLSAEGDLPKRQATNQVSQIMSRKFPLAIGEVKIAGRVLVAPMTGVSDLPFRRAASRMGAAYVATEMVACAEFAKGRPDVVRRAAVGEGLP